MQLRFTSQRRDVTICNNFSHVNEKICSFYTCTNICSDSHSRRTNEKKIPHTIVRSLLELAYARSSYTHIGPIVSDPRTTVECGIHVDLALLQITYPHQSPPPRRTRRRLSRTELPRQKDNNINIYICRFARQDGLLESCAHKADRSVSVESSVGSREQAQQYV